MVSIEGRATTERAQRYLLQLCNHLAQIGGHHGHGQDGQGHGAGHEAPVRPRGVECSDDLGHITFDRGSCVLRASADRLALRIEADDHAGMQQIRALVSARLETIGRRDGVSVRWDEASPG
jgi:hypothetical protein